MIQFRVFFSWGNLPGVSGEHLKTLCAWLHTEWDYSFGKLRAEYYLWIINQIIVLWALSPPTVKIAEDEWKILMNECKLIQLLYLDGLWREMMIPSTGCTFLHLDYWHFQLALEPFSGNLINYLPSKTTKSLRVIQWNFHWGFKWKICW